VLPPLVRRFVERNAPTAPAPSRIRLRQEGSMQLKLGLWRPFTAEQEMSVERVEFSWRARFPILPLITLHVHDWYRAAEGGLEVRVLGLPLGRMRGGDISKGEAMRYLAELPWVPQAMGANHELEWRQISDRTVEVATRLNAERVGVLLHFDAKRRHRRLNSRRAPPRRRRPCSRHALPRRIPRLRRPRRRAGAN